MFPVTIAELNKPLSYALRKEDLQISALAHNTLIENNIKSGDIVNVPDAESEQGIRFINTKPIFKVNETTKCVQKRKKRVNDNQISTVDSSLHNGDSIFLQGCTWDPSMWACAYDAAIMSFFALYVTTTSNWKTDWSTQTTLSQILVNDLEYLLADDTYKSSQFNFVQNSLRSTLIDKNPTLFLQEPMPVAVSDILENICSLNQNCVSCLL